MASIKRLTPGQTIWDVKINRGLNRWRSKYSIWPVYIHEVNHDEKYVIASWNGNAPKRMSEREIKPFRLKQPEQ